MYTRSRPSLFLPVCGLVLVCVLLGLLGAWPSRADVGIQPILPDGSSIRPKTETPIQMASEKVVLDVRQATEWDRATVTFNPEAYGLEGYVVPIWQLSVAEVTADFTMVNPTSEAVSMTVWFPLASALETGGWEGYMGELGWLDSAFDWESHMGEIVPRIERFQVAIDGKPLAHEVSEWPNPQGKDKPPLPWASFPVTFPGRDQVLIQVTYLIWAQQDISGVGMFLTYVFQTGAGWAGPIGKAELVVNLPYLASAETIGAMPDGGQVSGHQVRWTWENLEPGPQDDFSIWLIRQERWEELEAARIRVNVWPEDGEAWLNLASTYRRLTFGKYTALQGFGETYQPLGVQAAQKALRLLPGDVRPHYELAMFYLAALPENFTPEELRPLLDELRIITPVYGDVRDWGEGFPRGDVLDALSKAWATETAVAESMQTPTTTPSPSATPRPSATPVPSATPAPSATPSPSMTPIPSATPQPLPTATVGQPQSTTGNSRNLVIIVAAGVVGLVIVGYLVKRTRGSPNR